MNILDIIAKKRDSKELTKQEIEYFVKDFCRLRSCVADGTGRI